MPKLEVESKFEVSQFGFECLKKLGNVRHFEDQLNIYYDTNWKLAECSATLRIRFCRAADPVLTLKIPESHHGTQRVMREFEATLLRRERQPMLRSQRPKCIDVERELPVEFRTQLSSYGVDHLERVGWVRNTRYVVEIVNVGHIELDRLELPDGNVVYEAEIETDDGPLHEHLVRIVSDAVPELKACSCSKFQRFRHAASRRAEAHRQV